MLKSSIAMLITGTLVLLVVVNNVNCVQIGLEAFKKLEPCEKKCNNFYSVLRANPTDATNQDLIGCKSGCNILIMEGAKTVIGCEESCRRYTGVDTAISACVYSCMDFTDLKKGPPETVVDKIPIPAIEEPIITEVKKIDDSIEAKPAIPIDKVPEDVNIGLKDDSDEKKSDSSSSEEENNDDVKVESPIDLFKDFFSSELIRGEPQTDVKQDTKDSDAYLNKQNNDNKDTDDVETVGGTFDNLFSYFDKLKDTFKSAIDKGSYMLRVRIFSNGTVVKEYNQLPDGQLPDSIFDSIASGDEDSDSNEPKIIHLQDPFNINDRDSINWKGRPLLIGQPIGMPRDDDMTPPYHRFRECRPISFRFSTLCHDVNNMFNCASLRTGLPRWFFLTLVLSVSFLMIWLGIFILSMLRRIRKRERVIHHREEYLPLYKDLDFEIEKGQLNNSYIVEPEAGPLPPKTQI